AFLPTYAVVVAAVSEMLSSGLSQGVLAAVAAAWVVLASVGVASPLVVLVRNRDHADRTYAVWRAWILGHSRTMLYGVAEQVCQGAARTQRASPSQCPQVGTVTDHPVVPRVLAGRGCLTGVGRPTSLLTFGSLRSSRRSLQLALAGRTMQRRPRCEVDVST